jgi:uncharacterized membrane protein
MGCQIFCRNIFKIYLNNLFLSVIIEYIFNSIHESIFEDCKWQSTVCFNMNIGVFEYPPVGVFIRNIIFLHICFRLIHLLTLKKVQKMIWIQCPKKG